MKIERDLTIFGFDVIKDPAALYTFFLQEEGHPDHISKLGFPKKLFESYGLKQEGSGIVSVTLEPRIIEAANRSEFLDQVTIEDLGVNVSCPTLNTYWDYGRIGHLLPRKQTGDLQGKPSDGFRGFFRSIEKIYPEHGTLSLENHVSISLTEPEYQELLELPDTPVMRMSLKPK